MSITTIQRRYPEAIPMKQWIAEAAARCGLTQKTVFSRLYKGHYPSVKILRVNQRVIFIYDV